MRAADVILQTCSVRQVVKLRRHHVFRGQNGGGGAGQPKNALSLKARTLADCGHE